MKSLTVVGYVRVSKETEAGLSLEAQAAKIRAMAEVKGVDVAEIFTDNASAKSLDRPEMARLLALVEGGDVGTVIIAKLDRLTRSLRDLCGLLDCFEAQGVALVSIAESLDTRSSAGRLVVHIMGSVADWERREIGTRTRDVLRHKQGKGERVGTLPFGFAVGVDRVHVQPAPAEQRILSQMRAGKAAGQTYDQIATALNDAGETTRRGTAWRFQYVARALRMKATA